MATSVKIGKREIPVDEPFAPGHRACIGCGQALAVRLAAKALGRDVVIANATGCIEIYTTMLPPDLLASTMDSHTI